MPIREKVEATLSLIKNQGDLDKAYEVLAPLVKTGETPEAKLPEPKHTITANRDTVIKAKPVQSSKLSDSDMTKVPAGHEVGLAKVEPSEGGMKITIMSGQSGYIFPPHWDLPDDLKVGVKTEKTKEISGVFKSLVKQTNISQPDASTCQSACVAMATGTTDVYAVRSALTSRGVAGDPAVMSWYLNNKLGDRHIFDDNASMSEMREWLRNGEFLISYSWLTQSGHVIGFDGISINPETLSYKFDVADPWSEFDFGSWSYNKPHVQFYNGYYSALGVYAAFVKGQSVSHAKQIYASGSYDSNYKGAWVHRIKPA